MAEHSINTAAIDNCFIMNFIRHYGSKNTHIHQHMQTYTENKRADKQALYVD